MIRYRLTHRTTYSYQTPAIRARHFLHLLPRARRGQAVLEAALLIAPDPSSRCDEIDYFGNPITSVDLDLPHDEFTATLNAIVEITPRPAIPSAGLAWESIANQAILPDGVTEFRFPTRLTDPDDEVRAYARSHFTPGADIMDATTAMMRDLFASFRYRPGTTNTTTTGQCALKRREGVCQDYSHAMLACLRALHLPARYVSGYLRSQVVGGDTAYSGTEQTHAWVSVWLGPTHGWVDFDPTNDLIVSGEHVTLAVGRDFTDVSPTCGIILGGRRHTLKVSVILAPVDG